MLGEASLSAPRPLFETLGGSWRQSGWSGVGKGLGILGHGGRLSRAERAERLERGAGGGLMRGIMTGEGWLSRLAASGGVRKKPAVGGVSGDAGWKGGRLPAAGAAAPAWRRPVSVSTLANARVHQANTKVCVRLRALLLLLLPLLLLLSYRSFFCS